MFTFMRTLAAYTHFSNCKTKTKLVLLSTSFRAVFQACPLLAPRSFRNPQEFCLYIRWDNICIVI